MIATIILGIIALGVIALFLSWIGINPLILVAPVAITGMIALTSLFKSTFGGYYSLIPWGVLALASIGWIIKIKLDPNLTKEQKQKKLFGINDFE
ncbi:hypothetical protein QJU89_05235 [Pasteurella skyensis]|uniref:Uncharacterized protein n=1 Tax=Phocoenobacter skyensis TaxID=97481 RepID=A0AAJ6NB00_9PAST|nr:hypothetical protein [Pasteurella skyensis]MDP8162697.1 hypothetical protein [Pasteurella skyensis]MDP8171656.1 hypothetical protein [Pasteurella skyensis]MDP8173465.1 hypothetical protein [Pasteurella skyensis]MDP8175827.1 hypothetical protein [Pasteurella skyensis]MDP8177616.1 hypothetical protein [Pasteurella skyensis]